MTVIADILKTTVEQLAVGSCRSNLLWQYALDGRATPRMVASYLESLKYMVGSTAPCLARARDSARALGNFDLARFFEEKLAEEVGHDDWARADIAALDASNGVAVGDPVEGIVDLIAFTRDTIDRDPELYLAYMFWAEYMTTLVGGEFSRALVHRCGIPKQALTCLDRHVELDLAHADEGMDMLDRFVTDPRKVDAMRAVVTTAAGLFDRACGQMVEFDLPADKLAS